MRRIGDAIASAPLPGYTPTTTRPSVPSSAARLHDGFAAPFSSVNTKTGALVTGGGVKCTCDTDAPANTEALGTQFGLGHTQVVMCDSTHSDQKCVARDGTPWYSFVGVATGEYDAHTDHDPKHCSFVDLRSGDCFQGGAMSPNGGDRSAPCGGMQGMPKRVHGGAVILRVKPDGVSLAISYDASEGGGRTQHSFPLSFKPGVLTSGELKAFAIASRSNPLQCPRLLETASGEQAAEMEERALRQVLAERDNPRRVAQLWRAAKPRAEPLPRNRALLRRAEQAVAQAAERAAATAKQEAAHAQQAKFFLGAGCAALVAVLCYKPAIFGLG